MEAQGLGAPHPSVPVSLPLGPAEVREASGPPGVLNRLWSPWEPGSGGLGRGEGAEQERRGGDRRRPAADQWGPPSPAAKPEWQPRRLTIVPLGPPRPLSAWGSHPWPLGCPPRPWQPRPALRSAPPGLPAGFTCQGRFRPEQKTGPAGFSWGPVALATLAPGAAASNHSCWIRLEQLRGSALRHKDTPPEPERPAASQGRPHPAPRGPPGRPGLWAAPSPPSRSPTHTPARPPPRDPLHPQPLPWKAPGGCWRPTRPGERPPEMAKGPVAPGRPTRAPQRAGPRVPTRLCAHPPTGLHCGPLSGRRSPLWGLPHCAPGWTLTIISMASISVNPPGPHEEDLGEQTTTL